MKLSKTQKEIGLWKQLFPSPKKWHVKREYRRVFRDDYPFKHMAISVPENFAEMKDVIITSIRGTVIPFSIVKTKPPIDDNTKEYFYIDFEGHPLKFLICYFNKKETWKKRTTKNTFTVEPDGKKVNVSLNPKLRKLVEEAEEMIEE